MRTVPLAIFNDINDPLINDCSMHLTAACVLPI